MSVTNNPDQMIIYYLPYVMTWIGALDRRAEDVIEVTLESEVVQDKEREAVERDGWRYCKPTGNQTVTLTFADRSVQTRTFTKSERER